MTEFEGLIKDLRVFRSRVKTDLRFLIYSPVNQYSPF